MFSPACNFRISRCLQIFGGEYERGQLVNHRVYAFWSNGNEDRRGRATGVPSRRQTRQVKSAERPLNQSNCFRSGDKCAFSGAHRAFLSLKSEALNG